MKTLVECDTCTCDYTGSRRKRVEDCPYHSKPGKDPDPVSADWENDLLGEYACTCPAPHSKGTGTIDPMCPEHGDTDPPEHLAQEGFSGYSNAPVKRVCTCYPGAATDPLCPTHGTKQDGGIGTARTYYSGKGVCSGYTYDSKKPLCYHRGDKPCMEINSAQIYAAASSYATSAVGDSADLVIDCRGYGKDEISLPARYQDLRRFYIQAETILIPWTDRGAPPLRYGFWPGLREKLPKNGRVVVTCVGAHGRTGTVLAALTLCEAPGWTAKQAIAFVRRQHCREAVETLPQEKYLEGLAKWIKKQVKKQSNGKAMTEKGRNNV